MFRIIAVLIFSIFPGVAAGGTIDLMWGQSNDYGVKSYVRGVDFADTTGLATIDGYYRYGKTEGIVSQDEGELGISYDPPLNEKWSLWLDESVNYDKVLGIDFENNLGVGLKHYVYKDVDTKFSLSVGILYQFTSWNCDDLSTCEQIGTGRYSYRAKFSNEKILLTYSYQPNMSESEDCISTFTSEINMATVSESISIVWTYENEYWSLYGKSETSDIKLRFEY